MFERLSGATRDVVIFAREEAKRLGHRFIGTEHLLLALMDRRAGHTSALLQELGLTQDAVRAAIRSHTAALDALGSVDAEALRSIGIDLDVVRSTLERTFGPDALRPPASHRR